jgi:hypothetical protein
MGWVHADVESAPAVSRRFIMQSELEFTDKWRVALTVLFVSTLTGGVVFRIATSRGPSWVFYAISAGVLALVALDLWDHLRAARAALLETARRCSTVADAES